MTNIEIAHSMGVTLIDETKEIEATLLDLLVGFYFPECDDSNSSSSFIDVYYDNDYNGEQVSRDLKSNIFLTDDADYNDNNDMMLGINIDTTNQNNTTRLI